MPTGLEAVAWAREVERLGAGEIVLTSMDADGTKNGYDLRDDPRRGRRGGGSRGGLGRRRAAPSTCAPFWPRRAPARPWPRASSITGEYHDRRDQGLSGAPRRARPARRPSSRSSRLPRRPSIAIVESVSIRRTQSAFAVTSLRRTGPVVGRQSEPSSPTKSRSARPWRPSIEAPVEAMPNEPEANKLFRMVMKHKGSDLHLKVGMAPAHAARRRAAADAAARRSPPMTWNG